MKVADYNSQEGRSILATLRALMPTRDMAFHEALRVAELQANRLLELTDGEDGPISTEIVAQLPRIRIEYREIPTSGLSYWDGQRWVICLNRFEPETRQRFTLFHEYKHIIDHGRAELLYPGNSRVTGEQQAEQAADYFAGCALMPKRLLKRAWGEGLQQTEKLANHFDVSAKAISVRLAQTGLSSSTTRCLPSRASSRSSSRRTYYRAPSVSWMPDKQEVSAWLS